MIDKMIDAAPGNEIPKLILEADKLLINQNFPEALSAFEKLVGMDPQTTKFSQVT